MARSQAAWTTFVSLDAKWVTARFPNLVKISELATGGQKSVFAGTHAAHGAIVIKIIRAKGDEERAIREIEAATNIKSDLIPKLFEHGEIVDGSGRIVWLLEQRVAGETLRQKFQRGRLDPQALVSTAKDVLKVLDAAWLLRIVHRDIKPENLICQAATGRNWVLDFGISRHLDLASLTATHAPFGVGTLGYWAPEQLQNLKREIDVRADLFSLGVTLYEGASGANPFRAGARDAREIILRSQSLALPSIAAQVGSPLDEFIGLLTKKRRDHRFKDARQALDWLSQSKCEAASGP
jgi:serine/threonine protein kinase